MNTIVPVMTCTVLMNNIINNCHKSSTMYVYGHIKVRNTFWVMKKNNHND